MSNIPISSLPLAVSLNGTEDVPIVQDGTTKRASVSEISNFPAGSGAFVVAVASPLLTQSRLLSAQSGVTTITDGGALGAITVGVATNGIGDAQLRQGSALSVIGNATNATANEADIVASADFQVLRRSGSTIGFGSIDLSQSAAVGSSILQPANGGTGVNNGSSALTLGGSLTTVGAFTSTFTMTGDTSVTFPTSGTLATTSGPALPSVAQGDLLYGSASDVLSVLPKSATATRYLGNTGASNNPAWAQVNLSNGVTATLAAANGGTGIASYALGDTLYASGATTLAALPGNTTANKLYLSQTGTGSASAPPAWAAIAGGDVAGAALTAVNDTNVTLTLGGTPATALLRAASVTAGWTGLLAVGRGGTGLGSGTSGGVLAFTGTGTLASSGLLGANAVMIGGGAGAAPSTIAAATNGQVLVGSTGAAPAFQTLSGDIGSVTNVGVVTVANGAISNAKMANEAAYTFKGNPTSGSAAPSDFTIGSLTQKVTPSGSDEVILSDNAASGAIKRALVSSLVGSSGVSSLNGQTGVLALYSAPQGRLTLATGVAVMTATTAAAATVYYTPSNGNIIPIYDGTNMVPTVFSELSQLTTDTTKSPAAVAANSNYDIFVWNDSGTIRATRGPAWTNNTTRASGLTLVNGYYVNASTITNGPTSNRGTYVGTIRSNASSTIDMIFGGSASGGTAGSFGVWNMYNRAFSVATVIDSGSSYTYSGTTRQARGSAGNQASFVTGLIQDAIVANYQTRVDTPATSGAFGYVGIGYDSTTALASPRAYARTVAAAVMIVSPVCNYTAYPSSIGYYTVTALEGGDGTNLCTFDASSYAVLTLQVWN